MAEKFKKSAKTTGLTITNPRASLTLRKIPTAEFEPKPRVRLGAQLSGASVTVTSGKAVL